MPQPKWKKFTEAEIVLFVQNATSYSEVARQIGYQSSGSGVQIVQKLIKERGIDISHFKGHAWNKNENNLSHPYIKKQFLMQVLYECAECKINSWNNKSIALTVHHKDGDRSNNDFSNLILLCPNCHSQTENFCGKNRRKYEHITDEIFLEALQNYNSINAACVALGIPANESSYKRAQTVKNARVNSCVLIYKFRRKNEKNNYYNIHIIFSKQ